MANVTVVPGNITAVAKNGRKIAERMMKMPRYIDANALDIVGAEIDKSTDANSFVKGMKHVIRQIDAAPTAPVEPVTHCGECQGWEPGKRKAHKCDLCCMFGFGPGDYCSLGHRKGVEK